MPGRVMMHKKVRKKSKSKKRILVTRGNTA